ncbi:MAG: FliM/FliN family flagellar motor C-terminal domain-containing protein [Phycisphaerae bacterium]
MAEATATEEKQDAQSTPEDQQQQQPDGAEVSEAQLSEAGEGKTDAAPGQIDILLDTTMPITVNLGEVEMQVRELLELGPGSVLKLDRRVGEPVDLYLRGIRFAEARLVVVEENLAVRIERILPAHQELQDEQG